MKTHAHSVHHSLIVLASVMLSIVVLPITVGAQDTTTKDSPHANHTSSKSSTGDQSLADQLRELQTKVARLEAALKQNHQGKAVGGEEHASGHGTTSEHGSGGKGMMKMGGMQGGKMGDSMKDMGAMQSGKGMGMSGMGSMSGLGKSGMGMDGMGMDGMKMMGSGVGMMGQMQGMGQMQMPSALPGFAGASHIYHVGATGFFLDHPQHITLTQDQQIKLNQIKEKTLLGQATSDRWISQGEQELWVLTSSDAPKAAEIEAKIREIEKLRGDKRFAYIRAVGEAARVLTDEQRQTLVGMLPPGHTSGADKQN